MVFVGPPGKKGIARFTLYGGRCLRREIPIEATRSDIHTEVLKIEHALFSMLFFLFGSLAAKYHSYIFSTMMMMMMPLYGVLRCAKI